MTDTPSSCWLDTHLARRLERFLPASACGREAPDRKMLLTALRFWQLDRLANSLNMAVTGSPHYKKTIGQDGAAPLLRELKQAVCREWGSCLPHGPGEGKASSSKDEAHASHLLLEVLQTNLARLPFTLPGDLSASPESFLAVSQGEVSGLISLPTSGTTGRGKRIFCTDDDQQETMDFFHHGMQYMVRPGRGDHVALLMSGDRPGSVGDLLVRAMTALGVPCSVPGFIPLSKDGEDAMMERLIGLAPSCIVGVPGQLLLLARHGRAGELARCLRCVLLSGDCVTEVMRTAIAEGLSAEVFVHYGLTETGLGGAVECAEHVGCHMREADLIHEVVDEEGRPLPAGEWGEIVITTLTRQAMPLLRYRTGDEGRVLPGACTCGSVLGRLEVRGRMTQRLSLPDGAVLHISDLDRVLYALPWVQGYTAVLRGCDTTSSPDAATKGTASAATTNTMDTIDTTGLTDATGIVHFPDGTNAVGALELHLRVEGKERHEAVREASIALRAITGLGFTPDGQPETSPELLPTRLVVAEPENAADGGTEALRQGQAKQAFVRCNGNRQ